MLVPFKTDVLSSKCEYFRFNFYKIHIHTKYVWVKVGSVLIMLIKLTHTSLGSIIESRNPSYSMV